MQQILSVAPILKGQKPAPVNATSHVNGAASGRSQSTSDDLIDFGHSVGSEAAQKSSQQPSQSIRSKPPQESHDLLGLQEPLRPDQPAQRVDSLEGSIDEFVDARSA